jgi:drug/metabolite transporter (DMT)-like permease
MCKAGERSPFLSILHRVSYATSNLVKDDLLPTDILALILTIIGTVGFVHTIRLGHHLHRQMNWVGAISYLWTTLLMVGWFMLKPQTDQIGLDVGCGAAVGLMLAGGYYTLNIAVRRLGVGMTQTIERVSSVLLPSIAALIFWNEQPTAVKIVGLVICLSSFVFLGLACGDGKHEPTPIRIVMLLVLALALVAGGVGITMRVHSEAIGKDVVARGSTERVDTDVAGRAVSKAVRNDAALRPLFFVSAFVATVLATLPVALRHGRPHRADTGIGILLGSINFITLVALYAAIAAFPAIVAFPTIAVGIIVLGIIVSMVVWKEHFGKWALVGVGLAGVGVVLVNL